MSLVEHDIWPWQAFFDLSRSDMIVFLIIWEPVTVWLAEVYRWLKDINGRPPWGLAVFRWTPLWLGDTILAFDMGLFINPFYDRVRVEPTIWASLAFSLATIVAAILFTMGFLFLVDNNSWPKGNRININRVVHTPYFAFMASLLFGATRLWKFGLVDGYERGLAVWGTILVIAYFATIIVDVTDKSPVWHWVQKKWPERTIRP